MAEDSPTVFGEVLT